MQELPKAIKDAIEALSDLPGIGSRSAERLVFGLLKNESGLEKKIAHALQELKEKIKECDQCRNYCEGDLCSICQSTKRKTNVLCIVETPVDLIAIERTHTFTGLYHVLHGVISPLNKVSPEDLRIDSLMKQLEKNDFEEIILATSGSTESEATALYLTNKLKPVFSGHISRLSRGIPSGGDLDYLDIGTLTRAMSERREI